MKTDGSRLQDPQLALSIYQQMRDADIPASMSRAKIDAMVNGENPFEQEMLDETGQSDAANFNTREAAFIIEEEKLAYEDLVAKKKLVTIECEYGDRQLRVRYSNVIANEFSKLIHAWDSFPFQYNILVGQNITHGVGVAVFDDEVSFQWKAVGWSDFKLPRDTPATESAISIAAASIPIELSELYDALKVCEETGSDIWNVDLLRSVIATESAKLLSTNGFVNSDNWEYIEAKLKENATAFGNASACKLWVIHFWIKEEDGTVTHAKVIDPAYQADGKDINGWLYFNKSQFKSINDCIVVFTYDNPISGKYHACRGRGWSIQPQVVANNILVCRLADGAMAATMNLTQLTNPTQTDLDRLAVAHVGNNEILPPGLNYVDRKLPDYTTSVLPVINFLQGSLQRNNTGARPQVAELEKNAPSMAYQIAAQNNASISASALNRFYRQLDKLFTTMFRRAIDPDYQECDIGGELVKEFRRKLTEQGVTQEILEKVKSVKASRSIGAGSAANRLLALQRVEQRQGSFDPEGRRNLTYDIVAEEVGEDLADRYVEPVLPQEQRQPIDTSIATFESFMFESMKPAPVLPNQDHFSHVSTHLKPLVERMDQLEQAGENVDIQMLIQTHDVLMTALPHIATHTQYMSGDRARMQEVKGLIQITQQLSASGDRLANQITRLQKAEQAAMQAEQERQQQKQAAYIAELEQKAQQQGPDQSKAQAALIQAQVRAQIMESEHKQKMRQKEEEFQLEKAMLDARNAANMLNSAELLRRKTEEEMLKNKQQ